MVIDWPDVTPPELTVPADIQREANAAGGATGLDIGMAFATDEVDPDPSVTNGQSGAVAKLQDANPRNDKAAIGKLMAFKEKVEDQLDAERISPEDASRLIDAADNIIADLSEDLGLLDDELLNLLVAG